MSKLTGKKPRRGMKYKITKSMEKIPTPKGLEEIVLPGSKLKFCPEQLQNLNFILRQKVEQHLETLDESCILAKSVAERFTQRLVCIVGMLDERFCSKYLISLRHLENVSSKDLTYLLRIDALSTPTLYEGDPEPRYEIFEEEIHAGYSKIKLHEAMMNLWGEFTNYAGYLRRDKIQSKVVELLAKATSKVESISTLDVDESTSCGSPGKVVDAATLHGILRVNTKKHLYYGSATSNVNFPNPKDFRIAIVDEPSGIRIHLEFLSPALCHLSLNVRLLVGIGIDYWAASTDFPFRISLGHTDCLLYHTASRTGMYLVGFGVHSSAWQIRFPAAENVMLNHYSPESTTRTVLQVTSLILTELNALYENRVQMHDKILTQHLIRSALYYELENDKTHPTTSIIRWSPLHLSTLVLKILDKLILALQKGYYPDYFFPKANLIANPGHLCENDYLIESHKVEGYMTKLFDEALFPKSINDDLYVKMVSSIGVETTLLGKWKEIVDKMVPPKTTRARRMSLTFSTGGSEAIYTQYTYRQMEYIGLLLKNVLGVRENMWKHKIQSKVVQLLAKATSKTESTSCFDINEFTSCGSPKKVVDAATLHRILSNEHKGWIKLRRHQEDPAEDIVYLLVTILEQARDAYLNKCLDSKAKEKLKLNFYVSTNKLVQLVRRDPDVNLENIQDDIQMVKIILKWLYKSMDQSKKYFAPILRPYLNLVFTASHAVSWHVQDIKRSFENDELESLGIFAQLINSDKLSPAHGLVDACNKKWIWAKDMLEVLEKGKLRLILIPERGKVSRHTLSATMSKRDIFKGKEKPPSRSTRSFSIRSYFDAVLHRATSLQSNLPIHDTLSQRSPMTHTLKSMQRNGDHRCAGDVLRALLSMHRVNVLQEIASALPQEDRSDLLNHIQTLIDDKAKKPSDKIWSKTLPRFEKGVLPPDNLSKEKYTLIEESAGIRNKGDKSSVENGSEEIDELIRKLHTKESLLGSCRAARIKDNRTMLYLQNGLKAIGNPRGGRL